MSPFRHLDESLLIDGTEESMARIAPSAVTGCVDHEPSLPQARLTRQTTDVTECDSVAPGSASLSSGRKFDNDQDRDEDDDESDWDEDEEDDEDWDEDQDDDEEEDWDEDEDWDDEDEDWDDEDDEDEDWDDDVEDESDLEGTADRNCL